MPRFTQNSSGCVLSSYFPQHQLGVSSLVCLVLCSSMVERSQCTMSPCREVDSSTHPVKYLSHLFCFLVKYLRLPLDKCSKDHKCALCGAVVEPQITYPSIRPFVRPSICPSIHPSIPLAHLYFETVLLYSPDWPGTLEPRVIGVQT